MLRAGPQNLLSDTLALPKLQGVGRSAASPARLTFWKGNRPKLATLSRYPGKIMLIVYLLLALLSGIAGATFALTSGAGILMAILAYVVFSAGTIALAALWLLLPASTPQSSPEPDLEAQRN